MPIPASYHLKDEKMRRWLIHAVRLSSFFKERGF
ncbi:hypothetical protein HBHAL_2674 [Halobacillus halophilus DSM 2266]|uniref:Uncharacterized protein n=1 Tax=Halobacillus halophilus (strain ATCC 35676 / DSM 2266 / JCM 20832 / KCTC 3685 / LMG 17431 / NBRC 102448 / NCIMB 2269) TaxID=866895 RepID=I0JLK4_HALH3|nr:hypothetical protein HBHAL_2674 [Halobacillus halophilus DSM 2266]